jgi:hypothetical protein
MQLRSGVAPPDGRDIKPASAKSSGGRDITVGYDNSTVIVCLTSARAQTPMLTLHDEPPVLPAEVVAVAWAEAAKLPAESAALTA